jgi:hemin uptake protein HemP
MVGQRYVIQRTDTNGSETVARAVRTVESRTLAAPVRRGS